MGRARPGQRSNAWAPNASHPHPQARCGRRCRPSGPAGGCCVPAPRGRCSTAWWRMRSGSRSRTTHCRCRRRSSTGCAAAAHWIVNDGASLGHGRPPWRGQPALPLQHAATAAHGRAPPGGKSGMVARGVHGASRTHKTAGRPRPDRRRLCGRTKRTRPGTMDASSKACRAPTSRPLCRMSLWMTGPARMAGSLPCSR